MYYEVLWALDKELFAVKIVNHFFFECSNVVLRLLTANWSCFFFVRIEYEWD